MGVTGEARSCELRDDGEQVSGPVHGLDGAQAQAGKVGLVEDPTDKGGQRWLQRLIGVEVAAPAAKVDSGEDEFVAAGGDEAFDVAKDAGGGEAAGSAACLGNDAKRTAVAAACLDFEVGPGLCAGNDRGFLKERMGECVIDEDLRWGHRGLRRLDLDQSIRLVLRRGNGMRGRCFEQGQGNSWGKGFMAVANDGGDSGKAGEVLGSALSVAAGGQDAGVWIDAVGSANEGPGFSVGFGSDAAGVDHDHISVRGTALGDTGCAQEAGD